MKRWTGRVTFQVALLLLCLFVCSCDDPVIELQRCPSLSFGAGTFYAVGAPIEFGETGVTASFAESLQTGQTLYGAHPLAVAPSGDIEISPTDFIRCTSAG